MLTDTDRARLAIEKGVWKYQGAKEAAIRDQLGESLTRHYQALGALIDRPEALAHDPLVVRRLQRLRDARRSSRRLVG